MELTALKNAIGPEQVISDPTVLELYSADISFVNRVRPATLVAPRTADDIQLLLKFANETKTPLIPLSSGATHFRGDTVPSAGGALVVDLSGMKQIMMVDRERRVAMCEPGVTFAELIPAVQKAGLRLNMPLLPRHTKSVVGSILEREPVTMPKYQWDISDPLACTEIYFGNGEVFRTGQAAGPGSIAQQREVGGVQKAPYGPGTASWHRLIQGAQGTLGIVTWMSMRCEILPSLEEPFFVGSSNLETLLELAHWLVRMGLVNECFILNRTNVATIFSDAIHKYRFKESLPSWVLFYTVAGYEYFPEERVSSHLVSVMDICQRLGAEPARSVGRISARDMLNTVQAPCTDPYWKLRPKGACQDVFFLTLQKNIAEQITIMTELAEARGYATTDLGVYIQPIVQGTSLHCEFNLFYDASNLRERERIKLLNGAATREIMAHGGFFSRPYGEEAHTILNRDAGTVSLLKTFRKIFDPNNLMNPGKVCF